MKGVPLLIHVPVEHANELQYMGRGWGLRWAGASCARWSFVVRMTCLPCICGQVVHTHCLMRRARSRPWLALVQRTAVWTRARAVTEPSRRFAGHAIMVVATPN